MKTDLKPCVVVLSGTPFAGKGTTAEHIARRTNFWIIDVDDMRQFEFPNLERVMLAPPRETFVMVCAYYDLVRRALQAVDRGEAVVLTGTFSRPEFKAPLEFLSCVLADEDVPLRVFLLVVSDEEAARRIEKRRQEGNASNIDSLEKFQWVKGFFRPIEFAPVITIETTKPPEQCAEEVLIHLTDLVVKQYPC